MHALRYLLVVTGINSLLLSPASTQTLDPKELEFFETRIRPVLVTQCYECHHSGDPQAGLTVDHRAGLLKGGDHGTAVTPGDLQSRLLQAIRHDQDDLRMPAGKPKLSPQTIADFETWVRSGAKDPRIDPPKPSELTPQNLRDEIFKLRKQWWSLQPIRQPAQPILSTSLQQRFPAWSVSLIDLYILHKLGEQDLEPAPTEEPALLLRRLSFALTGLPPDPADVKRLVQNPTPQTYTQLVDQYLSSIAYAERWSRHWMDWIRFAESHGSEGDPAIPFAYQYRDYLIRALAADVPISQLIREHFAGDLLSHPRINHELGINESAIGPAHLRMVFHGFTPTDAMEEKVRFIDDQINSTTKAFLGLTVSCARCHDHKFDAITQADYYALFGVFASCHPGTRDVNLPSLQATTRQELVAIKQQLRQQLSDHWLKLSSSLGEQLLNPNTETQDRLAKSAKSKPNDSVFYLWHLASQSENKTLPEAFTKQTETYQKQRQLLEQWRSHHLSLIDQTDHSIHPTGPFTQWARYGNGSATQISPPGSFAIALAGNRLLEDIYPRGIYSHLLSTRDTNVLISPRLQLDGKYQASFHVTGNNNAIARYVVRDYPREGTVYHVGKINKPEWLWQSFNLDYWDGEQIHFEVHTAADGAVLNNQAPHSWFGLRDARLIKHGELGAPAFELEPITALLDTINRRAPRDQTSLANCYQETTQSAINAWKSEEISDAQAIWLSQLLREGWLSNDSQSDPSLANILANYRTKEAELPAPTRVPSVWESTGFDQPLFVRGEHRNPDQVIPRRFLSAINQQTFDSKISGRLELAEAILDRQNPLTSRVMVNRIWTHLFGLGLVRTPDNFGATGFTPTHPELLDALALQFQQSGWSLKSMVREIVLSQAWQQSTKPSATALRSDPENQYWSHAHLHRLDAEAIRDTLLSLSGTLNRDPFGPSIAGNQPRRSIYVRVQRNALDPFLRTFDFPEPAATTGKRDETNVPAQALTMLNDPRVIQEAGRWAERVMQTSDSAEARLEQMFLAAFSRPPTSTEQASFQTYLQSVVMDLEEQARRTEQLAMEIETKQTELNRLFDRSRKRLEKQQPMVSLPTPPPPFAKFEFDDLRDQQHHLEGELKGGAKLQDGYLVLDGKDDYFTTNAIPKAIQAKTLEAWVQPSDLKQQGSGVVSHQTLDGAIFDSIVLGEQQPRVWLAGSDHFHRTQSFTGAHAETETLRPVHVAIVYHPDGRIEGYREGKPYGNGYRANSVFQSNAGEAVFTVGVRHLPAVGNRMLKGRVDRVLIYDQALSAQQIADSFAAYRHPLRDDEIRAAFTTEELLQVRELESSLELLKSQIASLGIQDARPLERRAWTEVARALLSLKEFLFLR